MGVLALTIWKAEPLLLLSHLLHSSLFFRTHSSPPNTTYLRGNKSRSPISAARACFPSRVRTVPVTPRRCSRREQNFVRSTWVGVGIGVGVGGEGEQGAKNRRDECSNECYVRRDEVR